MINFNVPPYTGKELDYIKIAVENQKYAATVNLPKSAMPG